MAKKYIGNKLTYKDTSVKSFAELDGSIEDNTASKQYLENTFAPEEFVVELDERLEDVEEVIPNVATSSNQLADKAFVNSSVQTATANFRGSWDNWTDVPTDVEDYPVDYSGSKTPTTNDYMVVADSSDYTPDTISGAWRFKYVGNWETDGKNGWEPEYQINEEPFTQAQLNAINSGITSGLVSRTLLLPTATVSATELVGVNVNDNVNEQERIGIDPNTLEIVNKVLRVKNVGGSDKKYIHFITLSCYASGVHGNYYFQNLIIFLINDKETAYTNSDWTSGQILNDIIATSTSNENVIEWRSILPSSLLIRDVPNVTNNGQVETIRIVKSGSSVAPYLSLYYYTPSVTLPSEFTPSAKLNVTVESKLLGSGGSSGYEDKFSKTDSFSVTDCVVEL